jgi:hypothetical protein
VALGYHPATPVKNKKKTCGLAVQVGLKPKKLRNKRKEVDRNYYKF